VQQPIASILAPTILALASVVASRFQAQEAGRREAAFLDPARVKRTVATRTRPAPAKP